MVYSGGGLVPIVRSISIILPYHNVCTYLMRGRAREGRHSLRASPRRVVLGVSFINFFFLSRCTHTHTHTSRPRSLPQHSRIIFPWIIIILSVLAAVHVIGGLSASSCASCAYIHLRLRVCVWSENKYYACRVHPMPMPRINAYPYNYRVNSRGGRGWTTAHTGIE